MVIVGNTPGTAQLEATARAKSTRAAASQILKEPSSALKAVQAKDREGHSPSTPSWRSDGRNRDTNSSSLIVSAARARAPASRAISVAVLPARLASWIF